MPKQKTHKGLSKRVKITASGKVIHGHPGHRHLLSSKSAKRRRRLRSSGVMTGIMAQSFKTKLCE